MEIKDILKNKRIELGLTLDEVGRLVGVSGATISRWESGDIANMRRDKIVSLANALKVSPAVIMGWDINNESEKSMTSSSDKKNIQFYEKKMLKSFTALNDSNKEKSIAYTENLLYGQRMEEDVLSAAHERTDIEVTDEMRKHDDDIMNDPSEWE